MKIETAQRIVAIADELGLDVTLRAEYSGRGMFGRTTAAVVGYRSDIEKCLRTYPMTHNEDAEQVVWDAMGKSDSIAY